MSEVCCHFVAVTVKYKVNIHWTPKYSSIIWVPNWIHLKEGALFLFDNKFSDFVNQEFSKISGQTTIPYHDFDVWSVWTSFYANEEQ